MKVFNNLSENGFERRRDLGVVKGIFILGFLDIPQAKGNEDFPRDMVIKLEIL